jgi:hypothetical protein
LNVTIIFIFISLDSTANVGRKRLEDVELMSDKTKKRRFDNLDEKLGDTGNIFFFISSSLPSLVFVLIQLGESQSVLDAWHRERTPIRDQTLRVIGLNLTAMKQSLPTTSTTNTAILKLGTIGKINSQCYETALLFTVRCYQCGSRRRV